MPELPEVEIAARNLGAWLGRRRVAAAHVAPSRLVRGSSPAAVEGLLVGRRVRSVERRGKWIRIALEGDAALFSHLGMTGKWVRRPLSEPPARAERARIDGARVSVRLLDARMFGRLVPSPDGSPIAEWEALGRDPLRDGLDAAWLAAAFAGRHAPVKIVLLDQALIAGIGNIQAIESLWRARIHPERRASSLSRKEVGRLVEGILQSIADTLRAEEGQPEIVYVEEDASRSPFAVYGHAGEPCPRCKSVLARREMGGRGTVYCPRCQK